nr:hypothetical protein [Tanacetum cinerariifolium]
MEVCGRIVILAPVVAVSVKGGSMMGSVPSSGEASSSIGYIGSGTKSRSCGCMNISSCSSSSCGVGGVCGSSGP